MLILPKNVFRYLGVFVEVVLETDVCNKIGFFSTRYTIKILRIKIPKLKIKLKIFTPNTTKYSHSGLTFGTRKNQIITKNMFRSKGGSNSNPSPILAPPPVLESFETAYVSIQKKIILRIDEIITDQPSLLIFLNIFLRTYLDFICQSFTLVD